MASMTWRKEKRWAFLCLLALLGQLGLPFVHVWRLTPVSLHGSGCHLPADVAAAGAAWHALPAPCTTPQESHDPFTCPLCQSFASGPAAAALKTAPSLSVIMAPAWTAAPSVHVVSAPAIHRCFLRAPPTLS